MENVIEAHNLTKKFGSFTAVDSISFNIEKGEVFGFLGANGAGKTTCNERCSLDFSRRPPVLRALRASMFTDIPRILKNPSDI